MIGKKTIGKGEVSDKMRFAAVRGQVVTFEVKKYQDRKRSEFDYLIKPCISRIEIENISQNIVMNWQWHLSVDEMILKH